MSNQIENNIIYRLPRELQIECLQFLIPDNEMLFIFRNKKSLFVGCKNVVTTFINRLPDLDMRENDDIRYYYTPLKYKIMKYLHKPYKIMEYSHENPRKIIIMCDVSSPESISQVYNHYIPHYIHLKIPFVILLNANNIYPSARLVPPDVIENIRLLQEKIKNIEQKYKTYNKIYIHWVHPNNCDDLLSLFDDNEGRFNFDINFILFNKESYILNDKKKYRNAPFYNKITFLYFNEV
jgi:hypothetical protein